MSSERPPLGGIRVVELSSEMAAFAGKLLADYGAEVILVEPPGGHPTRTLGPRSTRRPELGLWFCHYNTSKLGVELDIETERGATLFRELVGSAQLVLEAEPPGRLADLGLDVGDLRAEHPGLCWVSVTGFGRDDPRSSQPFTDLTLMAGGGLVWNNGYDDPTVPPMSSLGQQAYQTASIWAANAALLAIRQQRRSGVGVLADVSAHAAVNVTTEQATQWWLVAGATVQRQRGRHAMPVTTGPVLHPDRDGNEIHTGFPPASVAHLRALVDWIDTLGMREDYPLVALVELAIENGGIDLTTIGDDPLAQECFGAARGALVEIAARLSAEEFFVGGQTRGLPVGVVRSPDEAMADPHLVARGFPVDLELEDGTVARVPGPPVRMTGTPGAVRRAPRRREHQHLVGG